jgi:UDP-N-acetylmuramate--alanine ligase
MDTGQILADILSNSSNRVHLIGVAGSGMSGLAGLLLALGHQVSGCDKVSNSEVVRLRGLGLDFAVPSHADGVANADIVIYSSAIRPGNPDYDDALRLGKQMVRRADALAAIMHGKRGIVVAGMHGKTTTTAMAAHVLRHAGLHPSHYVGAEIPILGTNAHWDAKGEYMVAEGDESDGTIVLYHPEHAIILNIEEEHLDYYEDLTAIERTFQQLLAQTSGQIFYCADDVNATRLCSAHPRAISYGDRAHATYRFDDLHAKDFQSHFRALKNGESLGAITLNVPGRHNVSNALAVIALATELGVPFIKIAEALESFRGARRRFEIKFRSDRYMVVDDYAHHPSEVRATLAAAKNTGRSRIIVMFQPHRYTRTQALKDEFGRAFHDAAVVFVTDVYAASEPPIDGVSGQTIVDALVSEGHPAAKFIPDRKKMLLEVGRMLQPGDVVLSLGAGTIHEQGAALAKDVAIFQQMQDVMGPGVLKLYEPLSRHTTMCIGGPAQFWAAPETEEGFARLVRFCTQNEVPIFVIGRGSNLLVRDGGIPGCVIFLRKGEFKKLEVRDGQMIAGAGVLQRELAIAGRENRLGGFEWFEGIPGSVGGALRMNAGAMGGETFRQVVSVRFVDPNGEFHTRTPAEMDVAYRHVKTLEKNYAVSATFTGVERGREEIEDLLEQSSLKRKTSQPKESSAGCIFKNPGPIPAGKLVDELGLKGTRVGGCKVSEVHGNFIVNDRKASAEDVLALIEEIKATARRERGLELETEVQIIGDSKGIHD